MRFLSCEPLLGPVDLTRVAVRDNGLPSSHCDYRCHWTDALAGAEFTGDQNGDVDVETHRIHWVIAGGESGPGARPMHPGWARSLRDQCVSAGVPFFFKQWGEWLPDTSEIASTHPQRAAAIVARQAPNDQGRQFPWPMRRVGKGNAGRTLDGRTWDEMPEVR